MIKMKYMAILLLVVFLTSSCQKYLDIKRTNSESPISNANDLQLLLDNTILNQGYPSDMNLSSDDFYVSDNAYTASNVSSEDRAFYIWSGSAIRGAPEAQWQTTFKTIYTSNVVLEYAKKFLEQDNGDKSLLNRCRGTALFIRAYAHWWIAQLYAKPFSSTATQDLGIPLRLTSDINSVSSRGTVQTTYDSIIQDLLESVDLLPLNVAIASRPSKASGYAMLARVYLSMENYSEALVYATRCLEINNSLIDFNTLDKNSIAPFVQYNKEILFNSVTISTPLLEPGTTVPVAMVDPALASSYNINDLRGILYIKPNSAPYSNTYRFSGNYTGSTSSNLFNGLAVDEVYLIKAEAEARTGNSSSAMLTLNTLLRTRWRSGTFMDFTAINNDDALFKILTERRKELLFRGVRWTDLRRLNQDTRFTRNLSRTVQGTTYTLPTNDLRYVLLIPSSVINNSGISQNLR
jgi:tetratricopeptide (TPR) repeat protein